MVEQLTNGLRRTRSRLRSLGSARDHGCNFQRNRTLARQPESKAEAIATAKWLIDNGYNIDVGLGVPAGRAFKPNFKAPEQQPELKASVYDNGLSATVMAY